MSSQISEHVQLTITADTVGQARAGFGTPMVLSYSVSWVERTRTYEDALAVAGDFATNSPEYLAAVAIFEQEPHPLELIIGRGANKPTQVYVIGVAAVANNTAYAVNVVAPGTSPANPLTYTSDGSATNDEIIGGLVAALNGVASKNYTAAATGSGGSQVCTVTGNAAGNWFSIEVTNYSLLSNKQTHVDPGIAADLDAITNENDGWYALHTLFNSKLCVLATALWTEGNGGKIYLADVVDTDAITVAVGSSPTDTLFALFQLTYNRTAGSFYPSPAAQFSAAWMGRVLPDTPGSETWKFKTLAGIAPVKLTATQRTNLRARKANTYTTIGSENKTWEGTIAGGSFGYIDTTRGLDWLENNLNAAVFDAIAGDEKLPFDDTGIAIVRSEIKTVLKQANAQGIINSDFKITVPRAADLSSSDKAARRLSGIKFNGTLTGAIHDVAIVGSVST